MADQDVMCYIGRKSCGCVIAATVDDPLLLDDNAQRIGEWIMGGWTVERVTLAYARAHLTFCCPHNTAAQPQPLVGADGEEGEAG